VEPVYEWECEATLLDTTVQLRHNLDIKITEVPDGLLGSLPFPIVFGEYSV
jgi:hypothetical protein